MDDLSEEKKGKLVKNIKEEIENEKRIHKLLEKKFSEVTEKNEKLSFSRKLSDIVVNFVGSWKFIIFFCLFLVFWITINIYLLVGKIFDPYPFILLNLILSSLGGLLSILILMSLNRKQEIDGRQTENNCKINLKMEILMEDIHYKLDELLERQEEIIERIIYLEGRKSDFSQKKYKFMKDIFDKTE
ncbi:DUF1003 domain-containing protein [Leptotrichia sp. OH3620_COT-345]|uniref:DUF1003 domain-containing protein n=1 Tax=Leptotrichia sp. OH3620_COT-345 TaxID=2491048 RepID=UPI000F64BD7F|nr:DUF1003 domain-containing protein [Leptotrichia sp. OH3620_COT-345]RRD39001.1 DUF1003 domain-containing protein [Leptotrichia sp. OH3620_COT-345]